MTLDIVLEKTVGKQGIKEPSSPLVKSIEETRRRYMKDHEDIDYCVREILKHATFDKLLEVYGVLEREHFSDGETPEIEKFFGQGSVGEFLRLLSAYETLFKQKEAIDEQVKTMKEQSLIDEQDINMFYGSLEAIVPLFEEKLGEMAKYGVKREIKLGSGSLESKLSYLKRAFPRMEIMGKTVKQHLIDIISYIAHYGYDNREWRESRAESFRRGGGKPLWKSTYTGRIMDLINH